MERVQGLTLDLGLVDLAPAALHNQIHQRHVEVQDALGVCYVFVGHNTFLAEMERTCEHMK